MDRQNAKTSGGSNIQGNSHSQREKRARRTKKIKQKQELKKKTALKTINNPYVKMNTKNYSKNTK